MSCPVRFHAQCNIWTVYGVLSLCTFITVAIVLHQSGYSAWDSFIKAGVAFGTVTCVVWWVWIMKKLHDLAKWWINLHNRINSAHDLLVETKQDIRIIKQNYKQENNLFG
jgi:hypothetical protein